MASVVILVNIPLVHFFPHGPAGRWTPVFIGLHLCLGYFELRRCSWEGHRQYLIRPNIEQVWFPEERPWLHSLRTDVEDHFPASAAQLVLQ